MNPRLRDRRLAVAARSSFLHRAAVAALPAVLSLLLLAAGAAPGQASATITIINMDGPGEGFNDGTHVSAVGGNTGTTLGQQRLNCFQQAANVWGALLTSPVPIEIQAAFDPLFCTATSAVLGSAGPRFVEFNHPNFEFQNYWYHEALANKQAGTDLTPPFSGDNGSDIRATFNSSLGQSGCLSSSGWYYGFDHNEGTRIDLLVVLLHEFAHGLGFSTVTNGATGDYLGPPSMPAVWDRFLFGESAGLHWDQMTPAQIVASAIDDGNLSWDGAEVSEAAATLMAHAPELVVPFGSGSVSGNNAPFGAALTLAGVSAQAVVVVDPFAPTGDGCDAPFTNAAAVAGKIAVIDRGLCTFVIKARNAQNAGAIGCILVNNAPGAFAPSGVDPSITIPVIAIAQADGAALKSAIAGGPTPVTLRLSPTKFAGLTSSGHVRMYAPNPFVAGSSVAHFDVSATPNLLMEPAINTDLTSSVDLTEPLFRDIGWLPRQAGVPGAGPAARVALSGRPNPTRGTARLHFELATDEALELSLYDLSGRRVRVLLRGACAAGPHDVNWDGLDQSGHTAGPGVYLARLHGTHTHVTQHLVLVR